MPYTNYTPGENTVKATNSPFNKFKARNTTSDVPLPGGAPTNGKSGGGTSPGNVKKSGSKPKKK